MVENINEIVFVIDDDSSIRRSLALFLNASGYNVEALASSEEFLARATHEGVGCLILDVNLEGKSGIELQTELIKLNSQLPIIFITGKGTIAMSVSALKRGAVNFLEKPFDDNDLLNCIEEALALSRESIKKNMELKKYRSLIDSLTPREYEVLTFVITGALNKQIAGDLDIAEHTVKLHRHSICEKLGVKSVPELIQISSKAGISPLAGS